MDDQTDRLVQWCWAGFPSVAVLASLSLDFLYTGLGLVPALSYRPSLKRPLIADATLHRASSKVPVAAILLDLLIARSWSSLLSLFRAPLLSLIFLEV